MTRAKWRQVPVDPVGESSQTARTATPVRVLANGTLLTVVHSYCHSIVSQGDY